MLLHLSWRRRPELALDVFLDHLELALESRLQVILEETALPLIDCGVQPLLEGAVLLRGGRLGTELLLDLGLTEGQALTEDLVLQVLPRRAHPCQSGRRQPRARLGAGGVELCKVQHRWDIRCSDGIE